jgi:lysophospholipase L1-like esterase
MKPTQKFPGALKFFRNCKIAFLLLAVPLLFSAASAKAEILVKNGETIAFLGDSITELGWTHAAGYVKLTISGLEANGIKTRPIPAGRSGHKSDEMLGRLERDILSKKPDWLTVSCGVNDVWHGSNGISLCRFQTNITALIDRAQAAHIKVVLLTATGIGEDLENLNNKKVAAYNAFLRSLAKQKNCLLADVNADFRRALSSTAATGKVLTTDGVHMNSAGDLLISERILRTLGLTDQQLRTAQDCYSFSQKLDMWLR